MADGNAGAAAAERDVVAEVASRIIGLSLGDRERLTRMVGPYVTGYVKTQALDDRSGNERSRLDGAQHDSGKWAAANLSPVAGMRVEHLGLVGYGAQEIGLENVDDAFRYQSWTADQLERGEQVREALTFAAKAVLRNVPRSPMRTRALNALVDARMIANGAITWGGRF